MKIKLELSKWVAQQKKQGQKKQRPALNLKRRNGYEKKIISRSGTLKTLWEATGPLTEDDMAEWLVNEDEREME